MISSQLLKSLRRKAGATIVEILMYTVISAIVGGVIYQSLRTGSTLSTKNASVNGSHEALRSALDRLGNSLRTARNLPTLLDASGNPVSSGPAVGIRYDCMLGEPYVLDPVNGAGSLAASATSVVVYRSTSGVGPPPMPQVGDVLLIDSPKGTIRARISVVSAQAASGGIQKITLTFAAALGKDLSWTANQPQWTKLVRQEAFIVLPTIDQKKELRFYRSFEPKPTLSDRTKYTVVTDQIATDANAPLPFSIEDSNGDKTVQAALHLRSRDFDRWLSTKSNNRMNSDFHLNLSLSSRLRPKSTN